MSQSRAVIVFVTIFQFLYVHSKESIDKRIELVQEQDKQIFLPNKTLLRKHGGTAMRNPLVQTKDGVLRGFTMKTITSKPIDAFQGIPFAQPPVGELRFRDTVKSQPWNGIRDAIAESPECIQLDPFRDMGIVGQEDCLYLNVYRPQKTIQLNHKPLPVLVWIHGGGFFFGSSTIYGPAYLLDRDIILVTINYRLGVFGFLSTGDNVSPGNQALKDQSMALRWVHENIAAFGGDSNSLTIFGESAGGCSVHHQVISPLSKGLFHRAISESGSAFTYWAVDKSATRTAKTIGKLYNCTTDSSIEMVNCLRNVEANELVTVLYKLNQWNLFPMLHFAPVVEHQHPGAFLTETPDEAYINNRVPHIPFIIGVNNDEFVWLTSILFQDKSALADINERWDKVGPLLLNLNYSTIDANIKHAQTARKFYMGDADYTFESRHQFSQMISDRFIIKGSLEAMRYHSKYTGAPTYSYRFSYRGKYSVVQGVGAEPKDWGVSHLDELIYLLNCTLYYGTLKPSDEDFKMSQLMTGIWTNFATYGRPLINGGGKLTDVWKPIQQSTDDLSAVEFLDLNLNPKMIDDPYMDRYTFWKEFPVPRY